MNEIKVVGDEFIQDIIDRLETMFSDFESNMNNCVPLLNGEHFIREGELGKRLKLNRRTLQDYRDKGYLPYYKIGGTILYKESDIESILKMNYRSAWTAT